MHTDLIVNDHWEQRLIGLRESNSEDCEPLSLQVARAFSIVRYRGNFAYEPQSMFRLIMDSSLTRAFKADDPEKLPPAVQKLLDHTNANEPLDVDTWRRSIRLHGDTVKCGRFILWTEGEGWGRAFTASPLDGSNGLFGEFYSNADWSLGTDWPCMPLADALDKPTCAVLDELIRSEEESEGVPVELFFLLSGATIKPLYRRPQRFFNTDAFVNALERKGRNVWRCVTPSSLTESLVRTVTVSSLDNCSKIASPMRPIVRQSAQGKFACTLEQIGSCNSVIFVCDTPSPDLAEYLPHLAGVIAEKANPSSHLAILLARDGIPFFECDNITAVCRSLTTETELTIDGINGVLYEGCGDVQVPPVSDALLRALNSAQEKNTLKVYANADFQENAVLARKMGANGIGLLRTEHLHTQKPWKEIVARLLRGEEPDSQSMSDLLEYQCHHLSGVFETMAPLSVTVRLLDAPLHEFDESAGESNPMMGYRGVRTLIGLPSLLELQCRAVAEAWKKTGYAARPKLMVPLVSMPEEFSYVHGMIRSNQEWGCANLQIGVMVETPRVCFMTDRLVQAGAQFFSFGTNDLTQFSWGLSRDDAAVRILPLYRKTGLTPQNPFERLDTEGVGLLLEQAIRRSRSVDPDIPMSVCGEQAADLHATRFLYRAGVTGLSVAPNLVPQAIAAAAQTQEIYS